MSKQIPVLSYNPVLLCIYDDGHPGHVLQPGSDGLEKFTHFKLLLKIYFKPIAAIFSAENGHMGQKGKG